MVSYLKHVWFIISMGLGALAGILILFILASVFAVFLGGALFVYSISHGLQAIYRAINAQHDIYVKLKGKK